MTIVVPSNRMMTKLKRIWAILTHENISLYAEKEYGTEYLTTIENNRKASNHACNMCLHAKSILYKTPCLPSVHCKMYEKEY